MKCMHVSTFYCIHSTFRQLCSCETWTTFSTFCLFLIRSFLLILIFFSALLSAGLKFWFGITSYFSFNFFGKPSCELGKSLELVGLGLVYRFGSIFESIGPVFQRYVENRETYNHNYDWCFCKPPQHKYLAFF